MEGGHHQQRCSECLFLLQSYHCYEWVNILYLMPFTHLKLVCPHIPVSCWAAYIKNSTLEIAVTDIYKMFVLKYRIAKEEMSVSKTCGVAFE